MGLRGEGLNICSGRCGWEGVEQVLVEELVVAVVWRGAL